MAPYTIHPGQSTHLVKNTWSRRARNAKYNSNGKPVTSEKLPWKLCFVLADAIDVFRAI